MRQFDPAVLYTVMLTFPSKVLGGARISYFCYFLKGCFYNVFDCTGILSGYTVPERPVLGFILVIRHS